jgi:hypothetical protein
MSEKHLVLLALPIVLAACGGSSSRQGFDDTPAPAATDTTSAPAPTGSLDTTTPPAPPPGNEVHEVYGHSFDTLYKLDPKTNNVTTIGKFTGCSAVTDIALDESSNLYATTSNALYTIDKATAACTQIAKGSYPNSLSFVPKGTVDPNAEALVGYVNSDYIRIDTKTGAISKIGAIGDGMRSSGDIVSVKGGAAYLTVKSNSCNDCLVEVDPATGAMKKNWGSIAHKDVFGLAFWGGKVYGFDNGGELFEVTFNGGSVKTSKITVAGAPSDLSFWGAGSSTSAPLVPTPN